MPLRKRSTVDSFSSADLPVSARKEGYEAAMRAYFGDGYTDKDSRVSSGQPDLFTACMRPFMLGQLRGGYHMSNAPHTLYLAPTDRTSSDLDFYLLLKGEITFERDDGPVHLRSGDMTLLRASEPLSSFSSQMEMIVVTVPERLVQRRIGPRPLAINRTVSGVSGLSACLGALLHTAAQRRDELSAEEGLILQASVVDGMLHAVSSDCEYPTSAARRRDATLRMIKRSALNRVGDPELSPSHLAHDAGVSVRTVHRLFHCSGVTFREWLRERRLERCWEELTNSSVGLRSVSDVAFRWGFNDLTTFNRSFRAKYGVPPTLARIARALP